MITFKADERSFLRAKEQLALMGLSQKSRKRILKAIGLYYKRKTKKDMQAQVSPEGGGWRKRKRGKAKMFKGLKRKVKYFQQDNNRTVVFGWPGFSGYIARKHHEGEDQQSGVAAKLKERKGKKMNPDAPATRIQAKLLKELGYRLPKSGRQKRGRAPSVKYITQNMSVKEANRWIRKLQHRDPAKKWDIELPERRLIGASPKRVAMIIKREMKRIRSK